MFPLTSLQSWIFLIGLIAIVVFLVLSALGVSMESLLTGHPTGNTAAPTSQKPAAPAGTAVVLHDTDDNEPEEIFDWAKHGM